MPHPFLFICPVCKSEDTIIRQRCLLCNTTYKFDKKGISFNGEHQTYTNLLARMKSELDSAPPIAALTPSEFLIPATETIFRISKKSILRQGLKSAVFYGFENLFSRILDKPLQLASGKLYFTERAFYFFSDDKKNYRFDYGKLSCITTNGRYLEFKIRGEKFFQIRFLQESPLKYELMLQKILTEFYRNTGKNILEFQPALRLRPAKQTKQHYIHVSKKKIRETPLNKRTVSLLLQIIRLVFSFFIRVQIQSPRNLPENSPYFILSNHQSALDPFIILAYLNRNIAFITKSTSFFSKIERIALKIGRGIPTTRYQNDIEVAYNMQQFIQHGIPIGIFPEAERSWSGELHPFKLSVIKLLTFYRLPVVPVILSGTFWFMPRWRKLPAKSQVSIKVRYPFSLVPHYFSVEEQKRFVEEMFKDKLNQSGN